MILLLKNTVEGLKPLYDDDYEEKRKLKLGEVYKADIKPMKPRNLQFHRKYFALINCAWDCLTEQQAQSFHHGIPDEAKAKEQMRSSLQILAGHYVQSYDPMTGHWVHTAKSISFEKMNELEFEQLYKDVKDAVLTYIVTQNPRLSEDEFLQILTEF